MPISMKPVIKLVSFLVTLVKVVLLDQELLFMNQSMTNLSKVLSRELKPLRLDIQCQRTHNKEPLFQNNNSKELCTTLKKEKKKELRLLVEEKELDKKDISLNQLFLLMSKII